MTAPFTPEQEARVREIVAAMLDSLRFFSASEVSAAASASAPAEDATRD